MSASYAPPRPYGAPTSQALPLWLVSWSDRQAVERAQLGDLLAVQRMQDLRDLAKWRGWRIKGALKDEVIDQVVAHMADPANILGALRGLDAGARQLLHTLAVLGTCTFLSPMEFQQVMALWGPVSSSTPSDSAARLVDMGLAIPLRNNVMAVGAATNGLIPLAIACHLPPLFEGVIHPLTELAAQRILCGDPLSLVRTTNQILLLMEHTPFSTRPVLVPQRGTSYYLGAWASDPQELSKLSQRTYGFRADEALSIPLPPYGLADASMERLSPVAGGEARLEFIYRLCEAASIVQPGTPATLLPEMRKHFWARNELEQCASLARIYLQMTNWSELWEYLRANPALRLRRYLARYYFTPEQLQTELVMLRRLVLRALAYAPQEQWLPLDELLRLMRIIWPHIQQAQARTFRDPDEPAGSGASTDWFLAQTLPDDKMRALGDGDWDLAQGGFIRTLVTGPLYWLGLTDLAYNGDKLVALRLRGLAELYWDRSETPSAWSEVTRPAHAQAEGDTVQIERETIHVSPSAISGQGHNLLNKIARLGRATAQRFTYQLDAHSVYSAFEAGSTLADILAEWEHALPVPMPPSLQERLAAWWKAYGRIYLYKNVTIIEFADDHTLIEMKAVTPLEEVMIAEFPPRLAIIPSDAVEPLMASLKKAGYTPAQTDKA